MTRSVPSERTELGKKGIFLICRFNQEHTLEEYETIQLDPKHVLIAMKKAALETCSYFTILICFFFSHIYQYVCL